MSSTNYKNPTDLFKSQAAIIYKLPPITENMQFNMLRKINRSFTWKASAELKFRGEAELLQRYLL